LIQKITITKSFRPVLYRFLLLLVLSGGVACQKPGATPTDPTPASAYFPPLTGTDWLTTPPESLGWSVSQLQPLYDYLTQTNTRAFIVLKDGKIVLEKYFGRNLLGTSAFDQSSQWYWASAGKTLTGFMVGKAQQEKLLSIDQKTSAYLGTGWTALPAAKEALITVRHQITMTTGLDDGVTNSGNTSPANLRYKADAGTRWAYHNAPYTLLSDVVARAAGQPFETYFTTKLKNPIGMDGQWRQVDADYVFFSTARSMARFGWLMLNQARWNSQSILDDDAFYAASLSSSQTLNPSYGYLWWLNGKASFMSPTLQTAFPGPLTASAPADMVAAMGKNGQLLNLVPSQRLVVVRLGDAPDNGQVPFTYQTEIWKRLSLVIR
jgi:CubicO group peptidase (beta-lactamase class C family)